MFQAHGQLKFCHILREGNKSADAITALCWKLQQEEVIWDTPPVEIEQVLQEDSCELEETRIQWANV